MKRSTFVLAASLTVYLSFSVLTAKIFGEPLATEQPTQQLRTEAPALSRIIESAEYRAVGRATTSGDNAEALLRARDLVAAFPREALAHEVLGEAYSALGLQKDALKSFEEAARLDPNYFQPRFQAGLLHYNSGKYELSIEAFQEAVKVDPHSALAWLTMGAAFGAVGKLPDAANAYGQSVKLDPKNSEAWRCLGAAKMQLDDEEGARIAYREQVRLDPKTGRDMLVEFAEADRKGKLQGLLTRAKERRDGLEETIRKTRSYLNLWPNGKSPKGLNMRDALKQLEQTKSGDDYLARGMYGDAISAYEEAVKSASPDAVSGLLVFIGGSWSQKREYKSEIRAYREALRTDPTDTLTWSWLASSLISVGEFTEAREVIDRVSKAARNGNGWGEMASTLRLRLCYSEAVDDAQKLSSK